MSDVAETTDAWHVSPSIPEPERTAKRMECVDQMRRCMALQTSRFNARLVELGAEPVHSWHFNAFELRNADTMGLLVKANDVGGVDLSVEQ